MSLLQELGARLRATSDELPTGQVTVALQRLQSAGELLLYVRRESQQQLGVPELGNALEHAERAVAALRSAQDAIAAYLGALGLVADASAAPDRAYKAALVSKDAPGTSGEPPPPEELEPWWGERVTELTGEQPPDGESSAAAPDSPELLRRVAAGVRSGDRGRLGRDLHEAGPTSGLGLSALTPALLHRLAGDLLGHEPRPQDAGRLRSAVGDRVRSLLPGTSPELLDTLIDRVCRAPERPGRPAAHPADSAVTASVLTGVLLARLGRDPSTLDAAAPEPVPSRSSDDARGTDASRAADA
ncbi:hypothetical protein [Mangrovihabitans endophyticus]|uniref:Uncharacterized protein n=1 Tax=Mangrovihabitans endophyticus TaxID=1751298 RepID=A0A8J3C3G6_9ACTN|nr:hypothetical protein [Mangrovihabitans endophyticus]GGL03769.1 hypothetical protein GCM10012284_42940 [Mangrovihabitans endophyticus]